MVWFRKSLCYSTACIGVVNMVPLFWFEERAHGKCKKALVGHVFFQQDMLYAKIKISASLKFIPLGPAWSSNHTFFGFLE